MSHLLLLPESPRSRCVGTPIFTGENTLARLDCTRVCVHVFVRSRFMQPQFPPAGKNRARSLMNPLNSIALQRCLYAVSCALHQTSWARNVELSLLIIVGIAYSESECDCVEHYGSQWNWKCTLRRKESVVRTKFDKLNYSLIESTILVLNFDMNELYLFQCN